ncbi:unnamed protein product [Rhizophagus irregularis]|nr:unnamed protein product [Rhizophagus irregularis]
MQEERFLLLECDFGRSSRRLEWSLLSEHDFGGLKGYESNGAVSSFGMVIWWTSKDAGGTVIRNRSKWRADTSESTTPRSSVDFYGIRHSERGIGHFIIDNSLVKSIEFEPLKTKTMYRPASGTGVGGAVGGGTTNNKSKKIHKDIDKLTKNIIDLVENIIPPTFLQSLLIIPKDLLQLYKLHKLV